MTRIEITGLKDLVKKLESLGAETAGPILENAVRSGAQLVQNDARIRGPYANPKPDNELTGTLRRSIHIEVETTAPGRAEATIGTDLVYAARVEFGFEGADSLGRVYHQPPKPYLRPALDENEPAIQREIGEALKQLIERVAGS